jgi:hypothetical protein
LCFVASVYGGTRRAEPGESKKALSLWKKYCEGGKEGGVDGGTFIHCKHPLGPVTRDINGGEIDAETRNAEEEQKTQYIFVQPAPLHFNHNLQVKTSSPLEPKTVIYVRPAETSHTYNSPEIIKGPEPEHVKPELVFLEGPGSSSKGRSQKVVKPEEEESEEEEEKSEEVSSSKGRSQKVVATESEEEAESKEEEKPEEVKAAASKIYIIKVGVSANGQFHFRGSRNKSIFF